MLSAWQRHCIIVSGGWFCKAIFGYAVTYLVPRKHLDRVVTSKHDLHGIVLHVLLIGGATFHVVW